MPIVVEHSPGLRDGGYTLGLSDPGLDAAERMRVADALQAAPHMQQRFAYLNARGREKFAIDGPAIDWLMAAGSSPDARRHRAGVLHDRIRGAVDLRFGASLTSVATRRSGIGVGLSDGTTIAADLLVGADGLHSGVRALGFGPQDTFMRPLGARDCRDFCVLPVMREWKELPHDSTESTAHRR